MILVVPFPPSTNRMYRMFRGHMVLSDEARAYEESVGWQAKMYMAANLLEVTYAPVSVQLRLFAPSVRRDTDNCIKALLDSLQGIVYADDRQVVELHVYRESDKTDPRVEVEISQTQAEKRKTARC